MPWRGAFMTNIIAQPSVRGCRRLTVFLDVRPRSRLSLQRWRARLHTDRWRHRLRATLSRPRTKLRPHRYRASWAPADVQQLGPDAAAAARPAVDGRPCRVAMMVLANG